MAVEGNALHILQEIFKWAQENLTKEELNKLLLATDHERMIAWHVVAMQGKLEIFQKIWNLFEQDLPVEEKKNKFYLLQKKWEGRFCIWQQSATNHGYYRKY